MLRPIAEESTQRTAWILSLDMPLLSRSLFPVLAFVSLSASGQGIGTQTVAHWPFEDASPARARDDVSHQEDAVTGFLQRRQGVHGRALWLDGYTTGVTRNAPQAPVLTEAFSLEGWVALEAYPWGLCPIICQVDLPDTPVLATEGMAPTLATEQDPTAGYFFGVDADGRIVLQVAVGGKWVTCRSGRAVPLLRWNHVTGVRTSDALIVFLNGEEVGRTWASGAFTPAGNQAVMVGRNPKARPPQHPIRLNLPALYALEGLLDEVKVHDGALSDADVRKAYASANAPREEALAFAPLPSAARNPSRFGAWTTRLDYKETWDAPRREGPASDIVVLFDDLPYQYLFWRGTNYIPHWVTENGIWYTNEFNETWNNGALGCAEPMSDKQARFSRVQILEANDARVVIHWRYALVDTRYVSPYVDPLSGWGDWSDEYHTIYPDGVGVRKVQLWSSRPQEPHEFQESIVLVPAGKRPEDVIETEAVTLANLRGETHTYSWAKHPPERTDLPAAANIELIHTKSRARPFLIVSDAPFEVYGQAYASPAFRPFNAEVKRENSLFPWWNHWPVALIPSDGRWATAPDRIAHSSLTTGLEWKDWESTADSRTRIMLHGLTEDGPEGLVQLGRSWLRAPQATLAGEPGTRIAYNESERAYVLEDAPWGIVRLMLAASAEQPVFNPAFIVRGWRSAAVELWLNGKAVKPGRGFRVGLRRGIDHDDLVVWLRFRSTERVEIELRPTEPTDR